MKKVFAFLVLTGLCATLMVTSPVPGAAKKDKLRKSQNKIENNYIVVLDNAVVGEEGAYSIAPYIAEELAATHKGKLKQVYKNALNGFAVEMSPEDAERLSVCPCAAARSRLRCRKSGHLTSQTADSDLRPRKRHSLCYFGSTPRIRARSV